MRAGVVRRSQAHRTCSQSAAKSLETSCQGEHHLIYRNYHSAPCCSWILPSSFHNPSLQLHLELSTFDTRISW
ncbi:hypothetical protein EPR50_G00226230 [Perca flavescens]|uniref:Uncharacterized protein n=1 Tax=Perca flavescens TaxID=8167 RepID=A0A484C1E9_PERFV|nr:hypothetical protein EPR50_G00226230 [Perca flavescens]